MVDERSDANRIIPPFVTKKLDEERAEEQGRIITLRLNDEELAMLERQKTLLNTDVDAKALKFFWDCGFNVVQVFFGEKRLSWLTSQKRTRSLKNDKKNV